MKQNTFNRLIAFLNKLEEAKINYTLAHHRDEALMVGVTVPGERWEIEFLADGSVEVERFASDGEIYGAEALDELFALYSDFDQEEDGREVAQRVEVMPVVDEV
jgi:hypothetical protein